MVFSSEGEQPAVDSDTAIRVASVVSALSHALDLSTGQPAGHSVRTCLIGMRIAQEIGLSQQLQSDLFYALLLKDCGCSGNASKTFHALGSDDLKAKRDVKTTDWTRVSWETLQYALLHVAPGKPFLERSRALFRIAVGQKAHAKDVTKIRCERGSTLARLMGLSEQTALGILNLDEHWDGQGNPEGLRGTEISLLSRIMLLAQTLEVHFAADAVSGAQQAVEVANKRKRTWFDPDLVSAVNSLAEGNRLWPQLRSGYLAEICLNCEPNPKLMKAGDTAMDNICMAFANIIDAKSPFTLNHSVGVANATVAIGRMLGLPRERVLFLRHAALLHDLGKLGVSNAILEKPAKLDNGEWQAMKQHPFHTWKILRAIPGFDEMSEVAGSHHEKLDGKGYFRGLTAEYLPLEPRILAVADIFDALTAKRPYRDSLPLERVFEILGKDAPHALDPVCLEALRQSGMECNQTYVDLQSLNDQLSSHAPATRQSSHPHPSVS
jgi:HD-GYP domain-containing protein (c-di-GMP phosphodiesterase class II)